MSRERMEQLTKKATVAAEVISVIIILWLLASFIDINSNNMGSHEYASWNAFSLLIEKGGYEDVNNYNK